MTRDPTALTPVGGEEATEGAPPALPDVEAWLTHLVRTLKTCKLYDVNNPTVVRFREDLARELADLIERRGALSLEVTSTQMLCDGATVYAGRSREDNLAATFHRDGIRKVTFLPGIAATALRISGADGPAMNPSRNTTGDHSGLHALSRSRATLAERQSPMTIASRIRRGRKRPSSSRSCAVVSVPVQSMIVFRVRSTTLAASSASYSC